VKSLFQPPLLLKRTKMGGSQLSQLKQKLRDSGLSRTSNPKDQKKRTKQRKDLSASSLQHRNAKFQEIATQFNVFDVREDKKKFAVVTRRGTEEAGVKGAPSKSRSAGIEQVRTCCPSYYRRRAR
jgi:nucleolar protein 14